jgi:sulfhydrogenase subunit alpha
MKTVKIDHIAKTEGHMSFVGSLVGGDFAQARIETQEGARLIEGIMLGRKYYEAPVITARICGVCPIVHNLTSIKALEQALGIKPTEEILLLRKILINAQWIHSHALHVFFLSFPDLVGVSNNFNLVDKFKEESKLALEIRDFGVQIARIVGGRTVHPINSVVGGFNVEPDYRELEELMKKQADILEKTQKVYKFVTSYKLPKFERPTNYVTLKSRKEYSIYDGDIFFSDNDAYASSSEFLDDIRELVVPHEKVKRVHHLERSFMVGSLARVNNNYKHLNPAAKKAWDTLKIDLPCYNSFYNIFAQAVEIVHSIEEVKILFEKYKKLRVKKNFKKNLKVPFKFKAGKGYATMEAPRGVLYHEYELDSEGNMVHINVIAPTTMFLQNLEKDLEQFLTQTIKMTDKKRIQLIKTMIRSYDPCISCATH